MMLTISKWWQFTRERFDPASHLLMILLYVAAHRAFFPSSATPTEFALLFAGTVAFFYKLRLYDEIKDYELDLIINPTRPLARGLLRHGDLYAGIGVCILIELALFGFRGMPAAFAIAAAITYSLLMYKEFFIREKIRPHLTTYAVSHTVVSGFLSLALISALNQTYPWDLDQNAYLFALNSWCLFNIFEFGRKTYTSSEERTGVESYSKIFGRHGAVALVLMMAGASAACLIRMDSSPNLMPFAAVSSVTLLIAGFSYAVLNRAPFGKIYRTFSSVYIVLIYSGLVALKLWS